MCSHMRTFTRSPSYNHCYLAMFVYDSGWPGFTGSSAAWQLMSPLPYLGTLIPTKAKPSQQETRSWTKVSDEEIQAVMCDTLWLIWSQKLLNLRLNMQKFSTVPKDTPKLPSLANFAAISCLKYLKWEQQVKMFLLYSPFKGNDF